MNDASATRLRLLDDIKIAMKAGDKDRLAVLRMLSAAIKQKEIDERVEVDETMTLAILDKQLKQRRESISQYEAAGRDDLAAREVAEAEIIRQYLPTALSDAEIAAEIDEALGSSGAGSVKDMGRVMAILKPVLQGRADMSDVSRKVRERLSA